MLILKEFRQQYFLWLVVLIITLTGLLLGFDSGVISGAIYIIKQRFALSIEETQLVIDAMLIGACIGSLVGGKLADYYGRRSVLLLVAYIFIIGSICTALAFNTNWLIIGRLIIGLAIGMTSFIGPLYISEIAPPAHRGKLILLNVIAVTAGVALAYGVNLILSPEGTWRAMLGISTAPAILLGFSILIIPESPRWMAAQGWMQDARSELIKLRGTQLIDQEWSEIEYYIQNPNKKQNSILNKKWFWPTLLLGSALALLQQMTGIETILYYSPSIFEAAGMKVKETIPIATVEIEAASLIITIITAFLIDRVGRRKLMLTGLSFMLISLLVLTLLLPLCMDHKISTTLLMIDLMVFISSYAVGIGGLFWLIIAEIFPLKSRGFLMGVITAISWTSVLVFTSNSLGLLRYMGPSYTLSLHIILCALGLWICYRYLPETRGISLESIEMRLRDGAPLRKLGS